MTKENTKSTAQLFAIVWEFRVRRGKRREFEKAYGPDGAWAQLFRGADGYLSTELLRDRGMPLRYLTVDRWVSRQAFHRFKKESRSAYKVLDQKCESLTERERLIGEFNRLSSAQDVLSHARIPESRRATVSCSWQIRLAAPQDVPAMLALERDTPLAGHWQEPAYHRLFSPDASPRFALVVEGADRGLYGFVIASSAGEDWELENLAVRREWHRRGLGTQLMGSLITSARAQGAKRIALEVRETNQAARALYEKCGFAVSGRRRAYYANPDEDAVFYTFKL